jgi:hypothetical protein
MRSGSHLKTGKVRRKYNFKTKPKKRKKRNGRAAISKLTRRK